MAEAALRAFFDRLAERYEQDFESHPLARYQRQRVHGMLAPLLKAGQRILDVGCGTGADFPLYQQAGVRLTALDVSPAMVLQALRRAEQFHWQVELYCMDFREFRAEKPYDGIVMNFGVLNAFPEPETVLQQACQMVVPGGFALVVVMPPVHLAWMAGRLLRADMHGLLQRLVRHQCTLPSGLTIRYLNRSHIPSCWQVKKILPLGMVLPAPAQWRFPKEGSALLQLACLWDRLLSQLLPASLGGDHVAYLLQRPPEEA